jgi:hypothetical protein
MPERAPTLGETVQSTKEAKKANPAPFRGPFRHPLDETQKEKLREGQKGVPKDPGSHNRHRSHYRTSNSERGSDGRSHEKPGAPEKGDSGKGDL